MVPEHCLRLWGPPKERLHYRIYASAGVRELSRVEIPMSSNSLGGQGDGLSSTMPPSFLRVVLAGEATVGWRVSLRLLSSPVPSELSRSLCIRNGSNELHRAPTFQAVRPSHLEVLWL